MEDLRAHVAMVLAEYDAHMVAAGERYLASVQQRLLLKMAPRSVAAPLNGCRAPPPDL